ncbi:30S ribosomal protein S18 [Streptomyces sp. CB01881]|uniref:30S ribosomal protein S18 n=1 Tax=Streptomyces sp. CB01881 TaxID=2078691 RepID=UPI000CDCC5FC|nr:30S ribosomal protein S18 [Streptomyces sp. CB01881]AUY52603.1 30S ribosomal protein S18 [Streptomyces sp. CB01881]TYC70322.1 30S ribosomal protein S18 [Streptomyces sp. CB01881]
MAKRPGPGRPTKPRPNPLIEAGITYIDYKAPLTVEGGNLLRRFISDRGKIRSRRVTRLTVQQQRAMARAIKNARETALLPYVSSAKTDR